jgi:hypothetical protein
MAKQSNNNYVDKAELCAALGEYRTQYFAAKEAGLPRPTPSNYIGNAFVEMATRMGTRPNWSGYTYLDEMILDAVENCIKYIYLFDPSKTNNPFGYFSRVIWRSFIKTMDKEKLQGKITDESVMRMSLDIDPSFAASEQFSY